MPDLECQMANECDNDVTHIDNKGFVYCAVHGRFRARSVPTRKLRGSELDRLKSGAPVPSY